MAPITYYFVVGSKQFLQIDEPLEEVLRERIQYYARTKRRVDFWLLPEPAFLNALQFNEIREKIPQPCIAIVSTNKVFITWLKIRLNNVFVGKFLAPSEEIKSPLDFSMVD